MIYEGSPDLGSDEGKTVTAGHVDYAPGVRSGQGASCLPGAGCTKWIPASASTPLTKRARFTSSLSRISSWSESKTLRTAAFSPSRGPQDGHGDVFGESVEDAGEEFQFDYSHNLVIEAVEVKA